MTGRPPRDALATEHPGGAEADRRGALVVEATVRRGGFTLEVALAVPAGEVVGVLGPNGAGKSTLLRALAGLEALSRGSIRLGGRVLDDVASSTFVPAEQRPVGLVFQDYRLFPHLDLRDNVAFGPRSKGARRRPARAAATSWLDRLGLSGLEHRRPHEISGGQAQRVALARALAADPQLLLLDEPLAALDARTRLEVRTSLRRHLQGFAGPALVVTHDPLEAMVLADRLVILEAGRVVQVGAPAQVARRPSTQYVARLVGLNLYEATLVPGPAGTSSARLTAGGTLVVTPTADVRPSDPVLVGLRPSAITVHTERPAHASPRNVWPGTVIGMELLADRVRVQVEGTPPALVDVTPAAVAELALEVGAHVWLSAKATETEAYLAAATG